MSKTLAQEKLKKVETILISQPRPQNRSPYLDFETKWGLQVDFRKFIQVEPVEYKDFRKTRIRPDEYSAIIFNSRNAIIHFFRICEEMRITMPQTTKYFCQSEAIANYLQKFVVYRKRKVFIGKRTVSDLAPHLERFLDKEKFLFPCTDVGGVEMINLLTEKGFDWTEAVMYRTVSSDLSDLSDVTYDILVFFSPLGIKSLYDNFPDFQQNETRLAAWGNSTKEAMEEQGLKVDIMAPSSEFPSMKMAIDAYLKKSNS